MKWVKSNGYSVRGEYWDVESGSKDTMDRPEFMRMFSDSERMGIRVLVFSDQSRLSRDIIVQESTFRLLSSRGYSLVSSENPESFIEDSPTSNLIRQILGSVSEFDKNSTVSKLRGVESEKENRIVTRESSLELEQENVKVPRESLRFIQNWNPLFHVYGKRNELSKDLRVPQRRNGYSVSFKSVERILKDIDWMKKERRMRRSETVQFPPSLVPSFRKNLINPSLVRCVSESEDPIGVWSPEESSLSISENSPPVILSMS